MTPIEPATPSRSPNTTDPDGDRQQRRRPARDRIDDRQVAAPVRRRQEDEVRRLDDTRRDPEHDALDRQRDPAPEPPDREPERHDHRPDAASIPIVAARSGSPAVLSRTFQARWRTAETATRPMIQGSTPGRYLPMSRRVRPNAQTARPPTTMTAADDDPDRVEDAGHRLAEVLVERQVEDRIGQLERRARACR